MGRSITETLSGAIVQELLNLGKPMLGNSSQIRAFWEELANQAIGVFIRATLPGTLWIAQIDLHIGSNRKRLVPGQLQSAIPGQRAAQPRWKFPNTLTQGGNYRFRFFARHLDQHEKA